MGEKEIKGKILIVDDNVTTINFIKTALELQGYRIFIATTGQKAVARAEQIEPDIILLDVLLPDIDGFETCARLKKSEITRDIPVLFMTGLIDIDNKVKGFKAGAVDYVTKPIEIEEVLSRIHTHITLRNVQLDLKEKNKTLRSEILTRSRAEEKVRNLNTDLENRVNERTAKLAEVNRMLQILSECNKILVHISAEDELFQKICGVITGLGGYARAEVCIYDSAFDYSCHKIAAGVNSKTDFNNTFNPDQTDIIDARNLAIRKIKSGESYFTDKIKINSSGVTEQPSADNGFINFIALSITYRENIYGTLNLYSKLKNAFDSVEINLLLELVSDLAFGIKSLREQKDRQKAEEALRISEERYKFLYDNNPAIYFTLDPSGEILAVNSFGGGFLGYNAEEITGQNILNFLHLEDKNIFSEKMRHCLRHPRDVFHWEVRNSHKDGTILWIKETGCAVSLSDDKKLILIVGEDITEMKNNEFEIERMNDELKKLNDTKDKFFSIIAHDLKSPFQALIGLAEMLSDPMNQLSDEEKGKAILSIYSLLKNQYELLQNLLDWSLLQQGRMNCTPAEMNLFDAVDKILSLLSLNYKNKNIEITNEIKRDVNVFADNNMLKSVLQNFIINAIKFTDRNGSIIISSVSENNFIKISIKDNGIGMTEDKLEKIFRLDLSSTTNGTEGEKGTGLGVILCKEMIERQGGQLQITSEINKGTTVEFTMHKAKKDIPSVQMFQGYR